MLKNKKRIKYFVPIAFKLMNTLIIMMMKQGALWFLFTWDKNVL